MFLALDTIIALLYLSQLSPPPLLAAPWTEATLALAAMLLFAAFVSAASTAAMLRRWNTFAEVDRSERRRAEILDMGLRLVALAFYVASLHVTAWPHSMAAAFGLSHPLWPQIFGVLPYIFFCFAMWAPHYPLFARYAAGAWTCGAYLRHRARYQLFVLGLWLPTLLLLYGLEENSGRLSLPPPALRLVLYLLLTALFWIFPAFLAFFWGCRPFADAELRARIRRLEERAGAYFSRIYTWPLGGSALLNAAAVGLAPPFRYLFISRGILQRLASDEIEAVAGHELGHIRHRHVFFYFLCTLGFLQGVATIVEALPLTDYAALALVAMAIVFYIRFGFGWFAPRLEAQADLAAMELIGSPEPLCRALEKIGHLSGQGRDTPSWHHRSIGERVEFLRQAAEDADIGPRHHARMARAMRRTGAAAFGLLIATLFAAPAAMPPGESDDVPSRERQIAHWRRVAHVLPCDPIGPTHLARLLASGTPEEKKMARTWTEEALRRARQAAERASLERILPPSPE